MVIVHHVKNSNVKEDNPSKESAIVVDGAFKWSEWVKEHIDDCGLCDPPLDAQTAMHILYEYLLPEYSKRDGCGYITTMPESQDQINSIIVNELLLRYSKSYKKERLEMQRIEYKKDRNNFWHRFFQSIADKFKEDK